VATPSGRTKKLGKQLSRAEVLLQLIHMKLFVAAACIVAGIVIPGRVEPLLNFRNLRPMSLLRALIRLGVTCPA
jgi:hypothetical protein